MTLHQFLRESTKANHMSAEGHPFQAALVNARLDIDSYARYLEQLRYLHSGVESQLSAAASAGNQNIALVMRPEYNQVEFLDRDLAALNAPGASIEKCVQDYLSSDLFANEPLSLLGAMYVLLGSKHGGKFIAHNIKQAYGFADSGWSYFNPYGETFSNLWGEFTTSLNELKIDETQRQAVLDGAVQTFEIFSLLGTALWEKAGVQTV